MGYSSQTAKDFIKQIAPIIQKEAKERGYHVCSPVIAQAICESAAGTSYLWYKHFNAFGMKCGSSWKGKSVNCRTKEEYTPGVLTSIRDNFRAYDNAEEGIKGYYDFISTKRYSNLKSATTPQEYLERIKADGYATSSSYVNTNMSIINKYDLTQYDLDAPRESAQKGAYPTLRLNSRGEYVVMLQRALNKWGFKLVEDGIYGNNTQQCVIAIQGLYGLKKDGICGKNTWKVLGYE